MFFSKGTLLQDTLGQFVTLHSLPLIYGLVRFVISSDYMCVCRLINVHRVQGAINTVRAYSLVS